MTTLADRKKKWVEIKYRGTDYNVTLQTTDYRGGRNMSKQTWDAFSPNTT